MFTHVIPSYTCLVIFVIFMRVGWCHIHVLLILIMPYCTHDKKLNKNYKLSFLVTSY